MKKKSGNAKKEKRDNEIKNKNRNINIENKDNRNESRNNNVENKNVRNENKDSNIENESRHSNIYKEYYINNNNPDREMFEEMYNKESDELSDRTRDRRYYERCRYR